MAKNSNFPVWRMANAWREILTRIFEKMETRLNVTPEWLVNPTTNRRLKLDMFYPQPGIAVRLEGLQGKQRRQRPSLEEEIQQKNRDQARVDVCRAHDIELVVVDVTGDNPKAVFQDIDLALSRAKRRVEDRATPEKIVQARTTASELARRVKQPKDLGLYADLWEDRQYQIPEPAASPAPAGKIPDFKAGMEVEHTKFGPGVILDVTPSNGEMLLTVDFITAGQKTLAASLVADKLLPR
jgi:hypothetical protein